MPGLPEPFVPYTGDGEDLIAGVAELVSDDGTVRAPLVILREESVSPYLPKIIETREKLLRRNMDRGGHPCTTPLRRWRVVDA